MSLTVPVLLYNPPAVGPRILIIEPHDPSENLQIHDPWRSGLGETPQGRGHTCDGGEWITIMYNVRKIKMCHEKSLGVE